MRTAVNTDEGDAGVRLTDERHAMGEQRRSERHVTTAFLATLIVHGAILVRGGIGPAQLHQPGTPIGA